MAEAIQNGVASLTWESDTFALADEYDEGSKRYSALQAGRIVSVSGDSNALLVRPTVARDQLAKEVEPPTPPPGPATPTTNPTDPTTPAPPEPPPPPRRFHGAVTLDTTRVGRDASQVADEVVAHVAALVNAKVQVTLEIHAEMPDGAPEQVVRTVQENCRTLKFNTHGFDES